MRIMLDTNVLVSLLLFPNPQMNEMMENIFAEHQLVLSSFIVDELKEVIKRKFPPKIKVVEELLMKMSYEYVYTPDEIDETLFEIRDANDYPVLYTAIVEDVDIFITGDKDFTCIKVDKPEILTPADFRSKYLQ